jgi:hypothetical protein
VRLVQVEAPQGQGEVVAQVAHSVGFHQATIKQQQVRRANQAAFTNEVVEVAGSTPTARAFVDALTAAPFFNQQDYSIVVRDARSILAREPMSELTVPWVAPMPDVCAELWQFSHITPGFAGRVLIAALMLAHGMLQGHLLTMLAGLLFIPFTPLMLAMSFGLCTRDGRLARQGALALVCGVGLAALGGQIVARLGGPPLKFDQFSDPLPSFLVSLIVGIAAGLATADDAGRREMIGLAATSQIAILAVWLGITLGFGLPESDRAVLGQRVATLLVNVGTLVGAAALAYGLLGMRYRDVRRPIGRAAMVPK